MMRILAPFLILIAAASAAEDERIITALSQNRVAITANFDGSEILIYGAIKRESPQPEGKLGLVITVAGPPERSIVRRKERVFGIWVNVDAVEVGAAPTFYAVASSAPIEDILLHIEDLRYNIRVERMIDWVEMPQDIDDALEFPDALVRIRQSQGLYAEKPESVEIRDDTLFGTQVALPANLVEGEYTATVYITRDGKVVDSHASTIDVRKVGLGRWIYALAHEQPLLYGLLSVLLAAFTGWFASTVFRRIA
ncbi:MAG: TIGR02186 family protein [Rhodobacteraceae bacterium]|nr:TIGR02186 family protein [Paracoccaceae bacterium]